MQGCDHKYAGAPAASVSEALSTRLSVRAFLARPVELALIEAVLVKATRAPSGGNLQPWIVRAIAGEELAALKQEMRQLCAARPEGDAMDLPFYPAHLPPAYKARRVENGGRLYSALGIDRHDHAARRAWMEENFQFFGAPLGLFFFMERDFGPYQWLDLGIYLQSVMLLLREAGLDSCAQADWALYGPTLEQRLQLAPNLRLVCGMAVGYRDAEAPINRVETARVSPFLEASG